MNLSLNLISGPESKCISLNTPIGDYSVVAAYAGEQNEFKIHLPSTKKDMKK